MLKQAYNYNAVVVNVVDGDTIDCDVDLGFHLRSRLRFRLLGVNCPEKFGPDKAAGLAAKAFVVNELLGKGVVVHTEKSDAFGRWLALVQYEDERGGTRDVASRLIATGHGEARPQRPERE